ncbi:MAG: YdjY domain-containing protein [Planctomycetota bacterium]
MLLALAACGTPRPLADPPLPQPSTQTSDTEPPAAANATARAPVPAESAPAPPAVEAFPGVRLHVGERWIEFDGIVPIDVRERDRTGFVLIRYLEAVAVTPASGKDHEALVLTSARPAHVHAALLALGLEPGTPGRVAWDGRFAITSAADGPRVAVTLRPSEAPPPGEPIEQFITHADDATPFRPGGGDPRWVFAGSLLQDDDTRYVADATGLLVGLHTFGSEVVALTTTLSPDSWIDEPEWIAHPERTPQFGASVTIRLAVDQ